MAVSAPDDDEVDDNRMFWLGVAGSGRFAIGVISIEVDVVTAPPDHARTEYDAPVAEDLEAPPAGLMGRNADMGMYKSFLVLVKAEAGAAGNVPVNEATS